jgi:hypothetical protein
LKIIGVSPAEPLVHFLFNATLVNLLSFKAFVIMFGIFECIIAILWLLPSLTIIAYYAVIVHLILTFTPLVVLPEVSWSNIFTPTLIGQYIIKNLLLLSCVMYLSRSYKIGLKQNH